MPQQHLITLSGDHLKEIRSALGAPLIKSLDWGCDSDDYIRINIATRIIRNYFTYFPIKHETTHAISSTFEIDYPTDDLVFRMFRHFFNYKTEGLQNFNNPFFLQSQVIDRRTHPYLRPYHLNEIFSRLSANEALVNYSHALRLEDYPQERKIKGSTTTAGTLSVQWAKRSNIFEDIPYNYMEDAIKLGKSYLIQDAARIRDGAKVPNSKVDMDMGTALTDATRWEEEVMTKWRNQGFGVIVK